MKQIFEHKSHLQKPLKNLNHSCKKNNSCARVFRCQNYNSLQANWRSTERMVSVVWLPTEWCVSAAECRSPPSGHSTNGWLHSMPYYYSLDGCCFLHRIICMCVSYVPVQKGIRVLDTNTIRDVKPKYWPKFGTSWLIKMQII